MTTVEERRHRTDHSQVPSRRIQTIARKTHNITQITVLNYLQVNIHVTGPTLCRDWVVRRKLNSGQKIGCSMPTARAVAKIYIKLL